MGLEKRVSDLLETYTDMPDDLRPHVAKDIATQLGRAGGPAKYDVKAVAKKDGVYLGESMTTKLVGSPVARLFAAVSQLDQTLGKLTSKAGAYQVAEIQACITVSEGLIKSLRDQYQPVATVTSLAGE
jgi:hypothetical protein